MAPVCPSTMTLYRLTQLSALKLSGMGHLCRLLALWLPSEIDQRGALEGVQGKRSGRRQSTYTSDTPQTVHDHPVKTMALLKTTNSLPRLLELLFPSTLCVQGC